jgi:histidyl-tRNA synthetase
MLRGTRVLMGGDARRKVSLENVIRSYLNGAGLDEVILPAIWEQTPFLNKGGAEIVNQMWAFKDKGNRDVCLIPEVTGVVQELWDTTWSKQYSGLSIFYVSRCYRYAI